MSFLSFRSAAPSARCLWCTRTVIARYLGQKATYPHDKNRSAHKAAPEVEEDSFLAAGITPAIASFMHAAFPNVQKPTAMQRRLIRAALDKRDILLQDDTGSGKSFAIMLALLSKSKKRKPNPVADTAKDDVERSPTTLLIVPHRDLAYQYLHWIYHMTRSEGDAPYSLTKYAQVRVRNVDRTTLQGLPLRMQEAIGHTSGNQDQLIDKSPHILIATPNAVLDLIEHQPRTLGLSMLSTVVVDEVDALLRIPSSNLSKERRKASKLKLGRHVPDLIRVLDVLYPPPSDKQREPGRFLSLRDDLLKQGLAPIHRPQLIMISATLRNRLRSALLGTFGWVRREKVLRLIRKRSSSALPSHRLGRSAVHHVLVVSNTGGIKNIAGALPSLPDTGAVSAVQEDGADQEEDEDRVFYDDDDPELESEADRELLMAPLAIDPAMLEAVAATFALDVPRLALLVLPATAAVRKIIFELRQLGVNAHPFNLVENEASRSHVLSRTDEVSDENPALIVATLATVRGIDLPDLSHVFMLGVPEGRSGDLYLHVAGRVGRFGRQGKVITVLEERREERRGKGVVGTDDPKKMTVLLSRIGIKPTQLEHFD